MLHTDTFNFQFLQNVLCSVPHQLRLKIYMNSHIYLFGRLQLFRSFLSWILGISVHFHVLFVQPNFNLHVILASWVFPCIHLNIRSLQSLTPILYPQGSSFYSSLTTLSSGSREVLKEAFEHPGPSSPGTNPISREMHHLQRPKLS